MIVTIKKSEFITQVKQGWKLQDLSDHYGISKGRVRSILQEFNLKIQKNHGNGFQIVDDTTIIDDPDFEDPQLNLFEVVRHVDFEEVREDRDREEIQNHEHNVTMLEHFPMGNDMLGAVVEEDPEISTAEMLRASQGIYVPDTAPIIQQESEEIQALVLSANAEVLPTVNSDGTQRWVATSGPQIGQPIIVNPGDAASIMASIDPAIDNPEVHVFRDPGMLLNNPNGVDLGEIQEEPLPEWVNAPEVSQVPEEIEATPAPRRRPGRRVTRATEMSENQLAEIISEPVASPFPVEQILNRIQELNTESVGIENQLQEQIESNIQQQEAALSESEAPTSADRAEAVENTPIQENIPSQPDMRDFDF